MIRILDPEKDSMQFSALMVSYRQHVDVMINPVYKIENLHAHSHWMVEKFVTCDPRHFKVVGKFVEGYLAQVIVGYRIEIGWDREATVLPAWSMGLLFSDQRIWGSPASSFKELNVVINESFEAEGVTTFYVVQKVPYRLLNTKDSETYFSKENYYKTLPYDRYNITLENIFHDDMELEAYRTKFTGLMAVLPKNILRPVMFLSARLDYFNRKATV